MQQPVAPNQSNNPIFTFDSNTTLTIKTVLLEPNFSYAPQIKSSRRKRADDFTYGDYGSGDKGELEPSSMYPREEYPENESGGDFDHAEKATTEDDLLREKREEDCKSDQQMEKISENLEKLQAEVEKISSHIFSAQHIKSYQKQNDGTRLPLCFFQPDPASLSGQKDQNYFTGQLSVNDTNPVTCVFLTPNGYGGSEYN